MQLEQLLDVLNYTQSPNYCDISAYHDPSTEHIYRAAKKAGVKGTYVIRTSPFDNEILPVRPVVYVAEAQTLGAARIIHRKLWNLGAAPFLLVLVPNQIRVYTGFDYSPQNDNNGLIDSIEPNILDIKNKLRYIFAESIDSGSIWKTQAKHLDKKRINIHLLNSIKKLTEYLVNQGLNLSIAYALIGKYFYIRYLRDRDILSDNWCSENNIDLRTVLTHHASASGLYKLTEALEKRFNSDIFPFPLQGRDAITDEIVSLLGSIFKGSKLLNGQLSLDFTAYDFSYIPGETLSSIYEQLINVQGQKKAVYTPEPLAEYLLCEINQSKPLFTGIKIFDPCCNCGTFLVLAYRRLIEMELVHSSNGKLSLGRLLDILIESIYGVEQNRDACYVAEFSLIVTMLNYVEPTELHKNKEFKFPILHNHKIIESGVFPTKHQFDWVVGNCDLIKIKQSSVVEFLKPNGYVGLIIHAESLLNYDLAEHRKQLFQENEVARITNFSKLTHIFDNSAPVATVVYTKAIADREKPSIIHFAPSIINQIHNQAWMITINEDETQLVSPDDAETGEAIVWKLALWGNYRDKRTIKRLNRLFTTNLSALAEQKNWRLPPGPKVIRSTSNQYFLIPEPSWNISCPDEDRGYLHAISIFFNSSIGQYNLFFHSTEWLVEENSIFIKDITKIPVPVLSTDQISEIVKLQAEPYFSLIDTEHQAIIDKEIEQIFNINESISIIARDFINFRLKLIKGQTVTLTQSPTEENLLDYGKCLVRKLDEFVEGTGIRHKISIVHSTGLIVCTVEILKSTHPIDITITAVINDNISYFLIEEIKQKSKDKCNQWMYTQYSIYIFDGAKIHICKASRLIDWTQTQALNDSDDIIAQVLAARNQNNEVLLEGVG
jgi:N-6 DNA Methylase